MGSPESVGWVLVKYVFPWQTFLSKGFQLASKWQTHVGGTVGRYSVRSGNLTNSSLGPHGFIQLAPQVLSCDKQGSKSGVCSWFSLYRVATSRKSPPTLNYQILDHLSWRNYRVRFLWAFDHSILSTSQCITLFYVCLFNIWLTY